MRSFILVAVLLLSTAGEAGTWFIPAAANASGAQGTNWRTEAVIVNPGPVPVCANLYFLEAGRDNSAAAAHPLEVPGGRSITLDDLVGAFFAAPNKAGAVRVEADGPLVLATRTFNDLGEAGTYGQGIPAVAAGPDDPWPPWERYLPNLVSDDRRRTNLGFVNASAMPLHLEVKFERAYAQGEWALALDLAPYEYRQLNDPLRSLGLAPVGDAYAYVSPRAATDRFLAWVSTVDAVTGDAVFHPGAAPGAYGILEPGPWARTAGLPGDEVFHAVAIRADGTVLIAGESDGAGSGRSDILLEEYEGHWDADHTLFGGPGDDKVFGAAPMRDGTTLLCGGTTSLGGWDAWFMKYARWGESVWSVAMGTAGDEWAYTAYEGPDGILRACGQTFADGAVEGDAWVLALDPAGIPLWQYRYGGAREDWTYGIVPVPGGGSLVAGGSRSFGPGDWDGWLLRLDPGGAILWQKAYGGPGAEVFYGLSALPDGTFIASGQTSSWGAGGADAWFVKVDADGAVVWETALGSLDDDTIYASAALDDGSVVAAGQRGSYGPGAGEAWLVRLGAGGGIVWQDETRGTAPERLYAVAAGRRGRIVAAGRTSSSGAGGKDALAFQTDLDGSTGPGCVLLSPSGTVTAATDATVRLTGAWRAATTAAPAAAPFGKTLVEFDNRVVCLGDTLRYRYAVPGAAHAPGANGTLWRTDVQVATPRGTETTDGITFGYLRAGEDNTTHAATWFDLYPGGNFVFEDVLWAQFDETGGYGTLRVGTDAPAVPIATTYTEGAAGGVYGFAFPALPADLALGMGERGCLPGLRKDAGFRTNLGLSNDSDRPISVAIDIRLGDGTALGSLSVDLLPFEPLQINDILGRFTAAAVAEGYAVVTSATPFASFFAYASVVDNRTGDPVFVPAVRSGEASAQAR